MSVQIRVFHPESTASSIEPAHDKKSFFPQKVAVFGHF